MSVERVHIVPRMLKAFQAAEYCGLCASNFKKVCPVEPVQFMDRIPRWDRHALDQWLDSLQEAKRPMNPLEGWRNAKGECARG